MEKVIADINPKSFYKRFLLKEVLPLILLFSIVSYWFEINLIIKIMVIILITLLTALSVISEYKYYTYKITLEKYALAINYYKWNKKKQIHIDINSVIIIKEKRARIRSVVEQITLKVEKSIIHSIFPEVGVFCTWTEKRVSELYDKLIEIQKEVIEKYSNENKTVE